MFFSPVEDVVTDHGPQAAASSSSALTPVDLGTAGAQEEHEEDVVTTVDQQNKLMCDLAESLLKLE
jgi:hypothetical protein